MFPPLDDHKSRSTTFAGWTSHEPPMESSICWSNLGFLLWTGPQEAWAQGLPPRATWPRMFVSDSLGIYRGSQKPQAMVLPSLSCGWGRELFGAIVVYSMHIPQNWGAVRTRSLSFLSTWQMFYHPNMKVGSNFCFRPIPGLYIVEEPNPTTVSWSKMLNCLILFVVS